MERIVALTLAGVACGACGQSPVSVTAPTSSDGVTGTVVVVFTRPAKGVTIALDGRLVVDRQHTGRVEIRDVAAGIAELQIAAGSGPDRVERHLRVEVDGGQVTAIPVAAPGGGGNGIVAALTSVAALLISGAISSWLF